MKERDSGTFLALDTPLSGNLVWYLPVVLAGIFLVVIIALLWFAPHASFSYDGNRLPWAGWLLTIISIGLAFTMIWGVRALRKDLNIRLKYEKALREREEESRRLVAQLSQSNEELEQFAYIASHDLQEPLHKVRAFSELLLEKYSPSLDTAGCDYLERMRGASIRMQQMIENLLALSRITSTANPLSPVSLDNVLHDVVVDFDILIKKLNAQIEIQPLPQVEGDPTQLRRLFSNLISNSLKYHRKGVKPVIKIYRADHPAHMEDDPAEADFCTLHVEDNGLGFEEEYVERIFHPFERLHGRGQYSGLGIGLAICKKILHRHCGTITARSTPGKGSIFIIRLPIRTGVSTVTPLIKPETAYNGKLLPV